MTSFDFEIDDKSRAGSEFLARVANEIRRAVVAEKSSRKLTQQAIADKIGTSRAVVNREISGLENLSARRIGELLWAVGWEPLFEARKPQTNVYQNSSSPVATSVASSSTTTLSLAIEPTAANTNELLIAAE